ncbi:MAG: AI-2E family transporter [Chloroflexi bacterium]|nr:AI-2E family transporter [Chloroflexota bacterium]
MEVDARSSADTQAPSASGPLGTAPAPPHDQAAAPAPGRPAGLPAPSQRAVLIIAAVTIAGIVLWMGREALSPFVIGLLLVYLLNPLVERVTSVGVPRWLAVLLVYVVVTFLVIEVLTLTLDPLVAQISQFVTDLPALSSALNEQLQRLGEIYRGLALPPEIRESIDAAFADLGARLGGLVSALLVPVFGSVAALVSSVFGFLIVPVWVFYILKDRRQLIGAFDRALPAEWREDVWTVARIVQRVFGQWVRAQVILGLTVGIATYAGLLLLGAVVDPVFSRFALFLALVAGLFELLPIIGPILAAIPAVLLAATAGIEAVIAAFGLYVLVQQVENNLLVPKIQGDAVELHPSAVMFALVVGGAIGGLLGAILSLPIAAAGRNVYRYLYRRLEPDPEPPPVAGRGLDGTPGRGTGGPANPSGGAPPGHGAGGDSALAPAPG